MREHTVDFPGFSTAPAGTQPSSSTASISSRVGGLLSGSAEFGLDSPHRYGQQPVCLRGRIPAVFRRQDDYGETAAEPFAVAVMACRGVGRSGYSKTRLSELLRGKGH